MSDTHAGNPNMGVFRLMRYEEKPPYHMGLSAQ
jgi:hypothetical protein